MEKRFLSSSQRAWLAGLRARGARVVPDDVASAARRASGVGYGLLRRSSVSLVAGLLGSLAAILVMVGLRLAWGTPTLPELVGERILPLMSANQFVSLLIRFQPHPKTGPLGLTLLGQFVLGIVLGPALHFAARVPTTPASWRPDRRALGIAGVIVLAMEVVALGVFWPVLPEGLFGDPLGRARLLTALSALLVFLTYVAVTLFTDLWLRTAWDVRAAAEQPAEAAGGTSTLALTRRRALEAAGVVVVAVAAGGVGVDRLLQGYLASSNLAYEGRPTPDDVLSFITPTKDFYVVSKNALDPTVIADHWRLELGGLVRQSRAWTYEQVRALPSETRVVTFECIANGVGGHLLSTAEWRGVSLQSLLALAGGATPGGAYVVFFSTDGYASSLPLRDLLEARTMLAWQMNGAPLADRHGFPLRVVVPGRYGEQSPKWLTRIEIANRPFKGFYQSQGWNDKQLETMSRIDAPRGMVPLGSVTIAGVAFAGIRGIQRVEVSADGGVSWHEARLLSPRSELSRSELSRSELSRSDTTWVFWTWAWLPPRRGVYTLIARATDGRGAVQAATERGTVPQGATGWPRVSVRVG